MIKVGSDFSGVGAFNQALIRLGIKYNELFACDMDKYARQTFVENYGEPKYFPKNVYDREIPKESLDIYMTSPPCQAFSLAGKRKGEDDDRGILFYNSHEFIIKNKPRYFIFENVKGLLSDDNGKTFQRWLDYLGGKSVNGNPVIFPLEQAAPYHIYWQVLNAKDYGIPQNRERVFIIGIRDDNDNNFSFPKTQHLTKRLKDVLEENVNQKYFLSNLAIDRLCNNNSGFYSEPKDEQDVASTVCASDYKIARGMNVLKIKSATSKGYEIATDEDSINFSVPNSETRRGRVGKGVAQTLDTACNQAVIAAIRGRGENNEQTLEINNSQLSNSLTTVQKDNVVVTKNYIQWDVSGKGYASQQDRAHYEDGVMCTIPAGRTENKVNVLMNDFSIRRLTPRECFRLMDFPDTFHWPVSDSQAYKQAGNSICVGVLALILSKLNFQ
jgi:DNA (cytosine-5)-methyltransferase 1